MPKLIFMIIFPIFVISIIGYASAHWSSNSYIAGTLTSGQWGNPCIKLQDALEGSFTNTSNGNDLQRPTDQITLSSPFPTKFRMTLDLTNCGTETLSNITVTDSISVNVVPINWTSNMGCVSWNNLATQPFGKDGAGNYDLVWVITYLNPGENATITIWVMSELKSASIYSGGAKSLQFDSGATVTAQVFQDNLCTQTEGITIDYAQQGTNTGLVTTPMPYYTSWAEAF
jgi:uncharacterized repeat protein (TIGR01451 family)